MKILSWDVGIYNLSYCILEKKDDSIKIIEWDIINLVDNDEMKKNRGLIFENIPRKLHENPKLLDVDIVVIENQPSLNNPQMKSIQMILYSYFLILGKIIGNGENVNYIDKIVFCSASNKLKVYNGPAIILEEKISKRKKKVIEVIDVSSDSITVEEATPIIKNKKKNTLNYADKKRLAIEHAKYFITKYDEKYIDFFNLHKKKDDLADSFLQGLYFMEQNLVK